MINITKQLSGHSTARDERDQMISNILEGECDMLANRNVEMKTVFYDQLELQTADADKEMPNINLEFEECAFEVEEVLAIREVEVAL